MVATSGSSQRAGQAAQEPELRPTAGQAADGSAEHPPHPAPRRRRHLPRRALIPVVVVLLSGAIAVWQMRTPEPLGALIAAGTIEVDEVTLSAEMPGRLNELLVDEGASVQQGQVVARLSDPVLAVQARQTIADAAAQQVSQAQLSKLDVVAPLNGVVQKRIAQRGQFVGAGAPIVTVADLSDLKLTVYVPEADLARVSLGQTVTVRADGYRDRAFVGRVKAIASRAEFTPRNVQTQKDRQNLVFAVTVRVPNADGALKAGLPVDATFE